MEINKTNITNEMGSSTISVYTSNINIKCVNKLRLILCDTPGHPEEFFDPLMCR